MRNVFMLGTAASSKGNIVLPAVFLAAVVYAAGAAAQTTMQVQVDQTYYQLPRWSVGAKLTAYCSDFAGGNYPSVPSRAKCVTAEGLHWVDCIREMKLGFIGASMNRQGRPPNKGTPSHNFDDWRVAANAVVAGGGGVMIEYMAGVKGMPKGTKMAPEDPDNVDPDPGDWSVQNCVDWADYMASIHGPEKIFLFEFYNEPACMNDQQMGAGGAYWYSHNDVKNAGGKCADWAINHQQDYYKAVKAKYPHAIICGASYAAPGASYGGRASRRYLQGYPGARVSATNPNTKYQDALSLHCYGYEAGRVVHDTPGAASGVVQAIFNSVFYPTDKRPGNVSGYKAGTDQWMSNAHALPGGEKHKLVDTEWWIYSPEKVAGGYPAGGREASHQAAADVLGWIVHCQNADRWQFAGIQYHCVNVSESSEPDAQGRPALMRLDDGMFCESRGKLWRTGRYYAIKDICARFANNYPSLVRCSVKGPNSPAGPRDNSPGTQIQGCAGLKQDKSSLAVCLANIGDSAQTVTIALGQRAARSARGVKIPVTMDVDTPLTELSPPFGDDSHTSISVTLEGYTAALVEVGL